MFAKLCEMMVGKPAPSIQTEIISEDEYEEICDVLCQEMEALQQEQLDTFNAILRAKRIKIAKRAAYAAAHRAAEKPLSITFFETEGCPRFLWERKSESPLITHPEGWVIPADPTVTGWHWLSNMGREPSPWRWDASIQVWAGQVANYAPAHLGHHNWAYVAPCAQP